MGAITLAICNCTKVVSTFIFRCTFAVLVEIAIGAFARCFIGSHGSVGFAVAFLCIRVKLQRLTGSVAATYAVSLGEV